MLRTYNTEGAYMIVTEELKKLRERSGLSMQKIANHMGYKTASGYQRWEDPTRFKGDYLPLDVVRQLLVLFVGKGNPPIGDEDILRLSEYDKIVIKDGSEQIFLSGLKETLLKRAVPIVSADRIEMLGKETRRNEGLTNFVSIDSDTPVSDEAFCLIVTDSSMEPQFSIGDKLICDPQAAYQPGDFVVAKLDTELAATVRKYRRRGTENGTLIVELVPLNADYPTRYITETTPGKVFARVVEHRRKV